MVITDDYSEYPTHVAKAVAVLRAADIGGPYAIALGSRGYTGVTETTEHGGYPVFEHLRQILDGPVVWAPAVDGAVVLSQRGGDFELTVGQDFSIGYSSSDATLRAALHRGEPHVPDQHARSRGAAHRETIEGQVTAVDVRRAGTRAHTKTDWLDSRHSFSFGSHYDPDNTHHGLLLVSNDDRVLAGTGFGTHGHKDMEIVTWVLAGRLEHDDSAGNHGELYPGLAQRMSAGSGIRHSENNPSPYEDVHFIQMWVPPDTEGITPSYEQRDINGELDKGGLRAIASGQGHEGAITIHQRDAVLWGGRLQPGERVAVPAGRHAARVRRDRLGRPRGRRARSPKVTRPASPTRARPPSSPEPTAPRS